MRFSGGCHCGVIRFSGQSKPNPEMLDCNCSICIKIGYLHLFIPHEDFILERGANSLTTYRFGSGQAAHLFCAKCGVKSFYQPRSHPDSWSVNYHCLNTGHALKPVITRFDGENWEAAKRKL